MYINVLPVCKCIMYVQSPQRLEGDFFVFVVFCFLIPKTKVRDSGE